MDHLLLPEGASHWIRVSYYAKEDNFYENFGKGFTEYPGHRDWSNADVWGDWRKKQEDSGEVEEETSSVPEPGAGTKQDKSGNAQDGNQAPKDKKLTDSNVEEFFQTWLFFGLLIEVLRLGGVENVTTRRFLASSTTIGKHTSHVITTKELPSMIVEWRQHAQKQFDDKAFESVLKICGLVGQIVDNYCVGGKTQRSPNQYGSVHWPVRDEITTSIIAVVSTLRKAAHKIYKNKDELSRWPITNSKMLHLRIQRKWCPSDTAMIMEDFDIDGQYFIAASNSHSLEDLDRHYSCTNEACSAKIDEGAYVTRHAEGCQDEKDHPDEIPFAGFLGPGYDENIKTFVDGVKSIMTRNHLPSVIWKPDQGGITLNGYAKNEYLGSDQGFRTPPYVAISHVWADGMGNPFHNSLPTCQLDRIQKLVDELCDNHLSRKTFQGRAGFWMDTLCCLVGEELKDFRKQSIREMREIYSEAIAVLVIDPWLTSIPSTAPMMEICFRIYTSGWSRRLWTHQEGFLGKEVFYQLQDKPVSLTTINAKADEFQRIKAAEGHPTTFPVEAQGKTGVYYDLVKPVVAGIKSGHFPEDSRANLFKTLTQSLGYRSTSKIDDELLCVASVIGLDVKPYSDVEAKSSEATAEKRMVKFLREIGRFRQGIIFHSFRRLKTPGYRWAPASMLGHRFSGIGDIENSDIAKIEDYDSFALQDKHVEIQSLGLTVNLRRFADKGLVWNPGARYLTLWMLDGKKVNLPSFGLPVDYQGYTIKFIRSKHGLTIDMAERRFGIQTPSSSSSLFKAPSLPKTPSFGGFTSNNSSQTSLSKSGAKSPPLGGLGGIGKTPSSGGNAPDNSSQTSLSRNKGPPLGSLPTLGSASRFAKFARGKSPSAEAEEKAKATQAATESEVEVAEAVIEKEAAAGTDQYVVYVAENDVVWEYDKPYALLLQKPLNSKAKEFPCRAMIGHCSVGPGTRTWVEALCSADIHIVSQGDSRKVTAGLDFVDVSEPKTSWVVT